MFDRFSRFKKCKFIVRINKKLLPKNYNKNQIKVTEEYINQQGILGNLFLFRGRQFSKNFTT